MQSEVVVEYVTTGDAARMFGYKDSRSIVRLVERGEIAGYRTPGGHWRLRRDSVLEAYDRYQSAVRQAS